MDNRKRDDELSLEKPLGIAGEPVPKDDRIRASHDEASVRRRRKRALGSDIDEGHPPIGESDDPEGATGIDMGAGGDGHGIKQSR
jgi:hypothetical protein